MKNIIIASMATALLLSNCATIVSKSNWPVTMNSNPQGLTFTVTNSKTGTVISQGKTPQQVTLKSGGGFFVPASYRIDVSKGGKNVATQELKAHFNGWYVGNIVFGGLIGILIVDPATGAMYRLPEQVTVGSLPVATLDNNGRQLQIVAIDSLNETQRKSIIKI